MFDVQCSVFDVRITLLPESAVLVSKTLIVADIHLGKSATFRARGLPVPEGDTARDLARIQNLIHRHRAENLVIAGDLFHAPAGVTPELQSSLQTFLDQIGIPFTLILGNHDSKIPKLPNSLSAVPYLDLGNIRILHHPEDASGDHFNIAGHWHPVARIPDGRRTALRIPCFLHRGNLLVLPSFGSFTGGAIVSPQTGDKIYLPLRGEVIQVPDDLLRR